jgi:hypothetical protein
MATDKELLEMFDERLRVMNAALDTFDQQTAEATKKLYQRILEQYIPYFATQGGKLVLNAKNLAFISGRLDKMLEAFTADITSSALNTIAQAMLKNTVMLKEYYGKMGFKKGALDPILKNMAQIYEAIGIDAKGNILTGSYLDRLATGSAMRDQLKNYVTEALTGKMELAKFQQGFKKLIVGSKDVDSAMIRYYKTYTHDAFMANIQVQDNHMAENLGLTWFVYSGTRKKTSRPFCVGGYDSVCGCTFESKLQKAFHESALKKWDKMNWSGKQPGSTKTYKGGYNCRHALMWVTEETAKDIDDTAKEDRS